ncbi:MAG: hypothetical protein Q8P83_02120 [bacterium]|nr:hypothetical protein [bacterium]
MAKKKKRRVSTMTRLRRNPNGLFRTAVRTVWHGTIQAVIGLGQVAWLALSVEFRQLAIKVHRVRTAVRTIWRQLRSTEHLRVPEMTNKQIRESSMIYLTWLEFIQLAPLLGVVGVGGVVVILLALALRSLISL